MGGEFVIYTIHGGMKMYFTGTHWGGPGYFNQLWGAYRFDTQQEADDARLWLDEELVVPQEHLIEQISQSTCISKATGE
ncbi:hypothetical protein [Cedecea colo]|uniref:Uncharacterized protein n=1 Tax=Cedecea colo TaxID=2552946 RepID=A0ABX0VKU3_9ENTR|nr:hypothetical protein [Cedecea colo]NIY47309.1 hypothetical protein [Cedecea colo]